MGTSLIFFRSVCFLTLINVTGSPEAIAQNMTQPIAKNDNDPFNTYNVLVEYKSLCGDVGPNDRVYCHFLHPKQRELKEFQQSPQILNPVKPMGMNTVGNLIKNLAKMAGIPHWKFVRNHDTCQGAIDALTNNPSVNPKDVQLAARHQSLNSQSAYQRATGASDLARQAALVPTAVA